MRSSNTSSFAEHSTNEGGRIVRLTLSRPNRRNALSRELVDWLSDTLDATADDALARVVIIAAEGPVFCAGHDLAEMTDCSEGEYRELFGKCARMMHKLRSMPQVVIARVHGLATAAGCQLVAACDLAVAADSASFATPGVQIGLFCSTPMVPLVRAIPAKAAFEMLVTGEPISAQRAYELGLVNRVVPLEQLDEAVEELAQAILRTSSSVIRSGKAAFYDQLTLEETAAYDQAVEAITAGAMAPDGQEGIAAFLEKRKPNWEA
jgi:enoyl-CoA hydratase/carnithine racemase